jgi:putative peptidoglycan lipid II flippase
VGRVLFLVLPSIAGILLLRGEIIRTLLMYGKFSASDAALASQVVGVMVISLFAQSLMAILARGFFAYHDTKTPLMRGIASAILAIGGGTFFAVNLKMGILGIALGFSLGDIVNFLLLYIMLSRKVGHNVMDWSSTLKMALASLVMAAGVYGFKWIVPIQGRPLIQILILGLTVAVGALLYFATARLIRIPEAAHLFGWLKKPVKVAPQESDLKTPNDLIE